MAAAAQVMTLRAHHADEISTLRACLDFSVLQLEHAVACRHGAAAPEQTLGKESGNGQLRGGNQLVRRKDGLQVRDDDLCWARRTEQWWRAELPPQIAAYAIQTESMVAAV